MLHPASLLLAWVGAAVAFQELTLVGLAVSFVLLLPIVVAIAPRRSWRVVRRSRWLFLSLALLAVFATPGELLPLLPGATREGIEFGAEHVLRLLLLLMLLGLLLERLETGRLMTGMYLLLAPAAAVGFDRAKAVARLMLVLEFVQSDDGATPWREWLAPAADGDPAPLRLAVQPLHGVDLAAMGLLGLAVTAGLLRG